MHSMFSTPNIIQHRALKKGVANKYSLSSIKEFEPQVNDCTNKFASILHEYADSNQIFDLGTWLQWYAFDVIGTITFTRTFGFMEERKDIQDIVAGIEGGLWYGSICGQVPEFHPWLLGNEPVMRVLSDYIDAVGAANPVPKVVKVCDSNSRAFCQVQIGLIEDYLDGRRGDQRLRHEEFRRLRSN
jgi:hypothetical protein